MKSWLSTRRRQRQTAQLASGVLTARSLVADALNLSSNVEVLRALLDAVDHLDAALALLIPQAPSPPTVVQVPVGLLPKEELPNAH